MWDLERALRAALGPAEARVDSGRRRPRSPASGAELRLGAVAHLGRARVTEPTEASPTRDRRGSRAPATRGSRPPPASATAGDRAETGLTIIDGVREVRRALDAGVDVVEAFICEPLLAGPDARAALDTLGRARDRRRRRSRRRRSPSSPSAIEPTASSRPIGRDRSPSTTWSCPRRAARRRPRGRREARQPRGRPAQRRRRRSGRRHRRRPDAPTSTNPNVIRASAGHDLRRADRERDDRRDVDWLRATRHPDPGRDASTAPVDYTDVDLTGPVAIVLGSEADGLDRRLGGRRHRRRSRLPMLRHRRQPERVGHRGRPALRGPPPARPVDAEAD